MAHEKRRALTMEKGRKRRPKAANNRGFYNVSSWLLHAVTVLRILLALLILCHAVFPTSPSVRRDYGSQQQRTDAEQQQPQPSLLKRPRSRLAETGEHPVRIVIHNETDFIAWCKQELGVETTLEIKEFEYRDYVKGLPSEDWDVMENDEVDDDAAAPRRISEHDLPIRKVRGLAATHDLVEGDVVIRIPTQALWSVVTLIDHDSTLRPLLGPEARLRHGWEQDENNNTMGAEMSYWELPLLAVALLHHKKLGTDSPLVPYLTLLQEGPDPDAELPFLWNATRLRSDVSEGIRVVARDIRRDMKNMYQDVVQVLIDQHPDVFGKPNNGGSEWFYDYQNFQWAFAMINTRHWQLPLGMFASDVGKNAPSTHLPPHALSEDEQQGTPPAMMPTEEWVSEHDGDVDVPTSSNQTARDRTTENAAAVLPRAAFLAPVADLLNFGRPCTLGRYDATTLAFEIVASCNLTAGQEVTFWYSDECDHVMVALYGFTHPLIPACPTAEEYRQKVSDWSERGAALQEQLDNAYEDLNQQDVELDQLHDILDECECCEIDDKPSRRVRRPPQGGSSQHVRGAGTTRHDDAMLATHDLGLRHSIRKMYHRRRARKTEF